jgi:hypothetical protein
MVSRLAIWHGGKLTRPLGCHVCSKHWELCPCLPPTQGVVWYFLHILLVQDTDLYSDELDNDHAPVCILQCGIHRVRELRVANVGSGGIVPCSHGGMEVVRHIGREKRNADIAGELRGVNHPPLRQFPLSFLCLSLSSPVLLVVL